MAPINLSVRSLLGSSEEEIQKIAEEVYKQEYDCTIPLEDQNFCARINVLALELLQLSTLGNLQ